MELGKEVQNKIFEIRVLESQIGQMEEQMRIIDREIADFQNLIVNLGDVQKIKNQDVIVPIGKNIFINSKIEKGDELLVNIGAKTLVKKNVEQTKILLEHRKDKFLEARENISKEAENVIKQIETIDKEVMDIQSKTVK